MNYFPTTVIDNFFTDPDKVVELATSDRIVWKPAEGGEWPGYRSQPLHEIDSEFFRHFIQRYLAHFYPWKDIFNKEAGFGFTATGFFQRVPVEHNVCWVHSDFPVRHTIITYLNRGFSPNSGTSIMSAKGLGVHMGGETEQAKLKFYSGQITKEQAEEARLKNNNQFEEDVKVAAKYNRTVGFDSSQWHAMHDHTRTDEDRLTLIVFLHFVVGADYPLSNSKQMPFFWDKERDDGKVVEVNEETKMSQEK